VRYEDDEPLTIPEVMGYLRMGRSQVYELIRLKKLDSFTMGKARRVKAGAVRAYVASCQGGE
jgi:excisionase family DNA binding protein